MGAFTHYWEKGTCELQEQGDFGFEMDHIAGNQFRRRELQVGDAVYVVNVTGGRLRLIGRINVDEITGFEEAEKRLSYKPYPASEHCFGIPDRRGRQAFGRYVPDDVVRSLKFVRAKGEIVPPKFADRRAALLDSQTLRGVRRLTDASAAKLEAAL